MHEQIHTDVSSSNLRSPLQSSPEAAVCPHEDSVKGATFKQVLWFRSECLWAITHISKVIKAICPCKCGKGQASLLLPHRCLFYQQKNWLCFAKTKPRSWKKRRWKKQEHLGQASPLSVLDCQSPTRHGANWLETHGYWKQEASAHPFTPQSHCSL